MSKYITRNCPALSFSLGFYCDEYQKKCKDCTGCIMKQIVELCKETCRKRCTNYRLGKKKYCGYGQILQQLDIQEVE